MLLALLIATAFVAARGYWRLYRVARFLDWRRQLKTVHGQGLWAALETLIHRRQTETRTRNQRLARLLHAYRQAASAMPDGALIVSRNERRILWFNKSARRLLGLHYPQSLNTRLLATLADPQIERWLDLGRTDEPLADLDSPADPNVRLSLHLLPYSDEEWLVIVRDITRLTRLEQVGAISLPMSRTNCARP